MSDEYFKAWRESQGQPADAVGRAAEGEAVAGLCPRCAGSGREPNARDLQCSKCLGSGAVVIPPRPAAADAGVREALTRVAKLEEVLDDLLSWFDKPSEPEWRIKAGPYGADDAVEAARAALSLAAKREPQE